MPEVLLFTNIIAPYRLPVFERLGEQVSLRVLFSREKTPDRRWQSQFAPLRYTGEVLPHRTLRFGQTAQIINPTLWRHLLRSPFDVAIIGDNRQNILSNLLISGAARARRRPLIVWTGITPGESDLAGSGKRAQQGLARLRARLFHRAAAVIAYGSTTRHYLARMGIPGEKVFAGTQIVPASLLPAPANDKRALGLAGKFVVLSLNYLVARKGLDLLLGAFKQAAGPDTLLVLVGSGSESTKLEALAAGDERILFPGYQEGSEKTQWYQAADLFVFPTLHDPWGLVVNEAMSFGLPILISDAAGCAADLIQDNGMIIPAGDQQALAQGLSQFINDRPAGFRMGRRSQEIIAGYTEEFAASTFMAAISYAQERGAT